MGDYFHNYILYIICINILYIIYYILYIICIKILIHGAFDI